MKQVDSLLLTIFSVLCFMACSPKENSGLADKKDSKLFTHLFKNSWLIYEDPGTNFKTAFEYFLDTTSVLNSNELRADLDYNRTLETLFLGYNDSIPDEKKVEIFSQIMESDVYQSFHVYNKFCVSYFLSESYRKLYKYNEGVIHSIKAAQLIEPLNRYPYEVIKSYQLSGYFASALKDVESVRRFYSEAISMAENHGDFYNAGVNQYNLALSYVLTEEYQKAIEYYKKSGDYFLRVNPGNLDLVSNYSWTGVLHAYLKLDNQTAFRREYDKVLQARDRKEISEEAYSYLVLNICSYMERLKDPQLLEEILDHLKSYYKEECENRYNYAMIYYGESQLATLKNQPKSKVVESLERALKYCTDCGPSFPELKAFEEDLIDHLIELKADDENLKDLNALKDRKIANLSNSTENDHVLVKQIEYWANKDLANSQNKVEFLNQRLDFKHKQTMYLSILAFLSLLVAAGVGVGYRIITNHRKRLVNSLKVQTEQKDSLDAVNKELVEQKLELEDELKSKLLLITTHNKFIADLKNKIKENKSIDANDKQKLLRAINSNFGAKLIDEMDFKFMRLNNDFAQRLLRKHPSLTSANIKHCIYIKMGMSSKEIAALNYSRPSSVIVAKSRLRKKLNLDDSDIKLRAYFNELLSEVEIDRDASIKT